MVALFTTAFAFSYPFPAQVFAALNKYPNPLAPHVISMDVLSRTIQDDGSIRSERIIGIQQDSPKWVTRLLGSQDVTYVREVSFVVPSNLPHPTSPSSSHHEPPKLLISSTNLTLSYLLQCRESISYLPHPWPHPTPSANSLSPLSKSLQPVPTSSSSPPPPSTPAQHPLSHPTLPPHTLFSQSALIYSTGIFATAAYPPKGISSDSPISPGHYPSAKTLPQRAAGKRVEKWSADRFEMNAEGGRGAMDFAAKRFWTELGRDEERITWQRERERENQMQG